MAVAMTLLLVACKSSRKAVQGDEGSAGSSTPTPDVAQVDQLTLSTVKKIEANRQAAKGIRAKAAVSFGGLSASGPLKMKRDEIIQVSLSALLGLMEVGRLELTPEYFFYLDRINHEYVKARWDEVRPFREAGVDFFTFQAIFWNELFTPGQQGSPVAADYQAVKQDGGISLSPIRNREGGDARFSIAVQFLVDASSGLIRQTTVKPLAAGGLTLSCVYSEWAKVAGKSFPAELNLMMVAGGKTNGLRFKLSAVQPDENIGNIATPQPGSGYKTIDINRLFSRMGK